MNNQSSATVSRRSFLTATSVAGIAGLGIANGLLNTGRALADTGEGSPAGTVASSTFAAHLSPEALELQAKARDFAQNVCLPRKDEMLAVLNDFIPADLYKAMAELGIFGALLPAADGGLGVGVSGACVAVEELAKINPTLGLIAASTMAQAEVLNGCPAAKERYLADVLAGDLIVTSAVVAPEGVSNVGDWEVLGVRDGDGWVLNGEKRYVPMNTVSGLQLFYGVDDSGDLRLWFVEDGTEGFVHTDLDNRCGMRGLAGGTSSLANVSVSDELCVPAGTIGTSDQYYKLYALVSAVALGTTEGTCAFAENWARTRTHDFEPLLKYQKQRHKLARAMTKISIMRAALYEACALMEDPATAAQGCMLAQMCKAYIPAECIPIVHEFNILLAGWGYHHVEWFHYYQDILGTAIMDLPTDFQYEAITELLGLTTY